MTRSGLLVSQFSTEAGFGSAAIRYLSDSNVSHVDLVVPQTVIASRGLALPKIVTPYGLLGARSDGGVQLRQANYGKFTFVSLRGCVVPDIDAAYEFAFSQIGKPYDHGAILDFFLHRTRKFTFDPKAWFCDCFNYAIYWKAGKKLLDCDNPESITPQEEYLSPHLEDQCNGSALRPATVKLV